MVSDKLTSELPLQKNTFESMKEQKSIKAFLLNYKPFINQLDS